MTDERHDEQAGRQGATPGGAEGAAEDKRTFTEEFKVSGERVVSKVKELIREGNVRRITLKNDEGKTLIEIPLTLGVIGTVLLPVWAGIGAIAALVADLTIAVEKVAEPVDAGASSGTSTGEPASPPAADASSRELPSG
jgi:hypothetical protein